MKPKPNILLDLTPAQLRRAAELKEQIATAGRELYALSRTNGGPSVFAKEDGRGKWKRTKVKPQPEPTPRAKVHWTQTPAGRRKLSQSIKAHWKTRAPKVKKP